MGKLYTATEIGRLIGVTGETIKRWSDVRLIPQATRLGLRKKRVWNKAKAKLILEFAKDNGYPIPEGFLNE